MADNTKIEWADATVNAVNGCSVVSPGCTNCYAMRLAGTRLKHHPSRASLTQESKAGPVWTGEVRLNEEALLQPLKWKRPRRIFWNAHGDLFHDAVPDAWIDRVFAVAALTPQHTHMILTKRSKRMREYMSALVDTFHASPDSMDERFGNLCVELTYSPCAAGAFEEVNWPLPNVWLGVSVEDQIRADERREDFRATPAAVKFVSYEPALGPVDWVGWSFVDQIIGGGESGPKARPSHPQWFRGTRDWCAANGVAYFHKQNGEWAPAIPKPSETPGRYAMMARDPHGWSYENPVLLDHYPRQFTQFGSIVLEKVGKKRAGRLLDGAEHNGVPA